MAHDIRLELGTSHLSATTSISVGSREESVESNLPFLADTPCDLDDHSSLGPGRLEVSRASRGDLGVVREVFHLASGDAVACRILLHNGSTDSIQVVSTSLIINDLALGDSSVSDWNYLRAPRKKNDMPACIRLGDTGPAIWDAARGTPETGGVIQTDDDRPPRSFISSELTAIFTESAAIVLGVLPADRQMVQSVLTLSADRRQLDSLRVDCLGDGQHLMPGTSFESQWVWVQFASDVHEAIEAYTTALSKVQPPRQRMSTPPTVWCSWYYYGDGFTQKECEENLTALEQRPLPIDVFQIDECWDLHWADWQTNADWPGLSAIAERVTAMGMQPGIWTCPVLAEPRSRTRYAHPEWLLRDRQGRLITFPMNDMQNLVLDPTVAAVQAFIEAIYRDLRQRGFSYFKLDFMRAVAEPGVAFADDTCNRADAFRLALEAVRRGAGEDAYINVCGGLYGPSLGLADAQRSGSDVKSLWPVAPEGEEITGYGPFTIKQNTLRYWMNRLWHNDPDALMVRRRATPARGESLSLGLLTDDEALTCTLNQYLGGGLVCFSENLAEIDSDRLMLLRHCVPSIGAAAIPRDLLQAPRFPAIFTSAIDTPPPGLQPWYTISVVNWFDEPRVFEVPLDGDLLPGIDLDRPVVISRFAAEDTQSVLAGDMLRLGPVPAHGCQVWKVQFSSAEAPMLMGTDGHFSMGAAEVTAWSATPEGLTLTIHWPWPMRLRLWLRPPAGCAFAGSGMDETTVVEIEGPAQSTEIRLAYDLD